MPPVRILVFCISLWAFNSGTKGFKIKVPVKFVCVVRFEVFTAAHFFVGCETVSLVQWFRCSEVPVECWKSSLSMFSKSQRATISFVMSVYLPACLSAWNIFAPTRWISMKFCIWRFFENLPRIWIQVLLKSDKNNGYLVEDLYRFMIVSTELFLEWEIFPTEDVEKIKTYVLYSVTFFKKLCHL